MLGLGILKRKPTQIASAKLVVSDELCKLLLHFFGKIRGFIYFCSVKSTIKNIILDFGGVIADLDKQATVDALAALGADASDCIGKYRQSGIFYQLETGDISVEDFCHQLLPEVEPHQVCWAWNQMIVGIPLHRLQALKQLSQHYNLYLLSNTNDIHWDYSLQEHFLAQGYTPEKLFKHIFLSQRMHRAKPDLSTFEYVLHEAELQAEETLYIDDSEENCASFARLGVETICPARPDDWLAEVAPCVATIGFFDGVHRGHQCLIEQVVKEAHERGMWSMLVTMNRHPRQVVHTNYVPQLLTSLPEKETLLGNTEADAVHVLDFTPEMSQLTAREFMQQVLHDQLGVRVLVMGYDHRFGHGGGTHEQYVQWGQVTGIEVLLAHELEGEHASSSAIRQLLAEGNVESAAQLLGHPYTLSGPVVHGFQVGHELGFPTANIGLPNDKLIPLQGAYAVWVVLRNGRRYAGMLNIGMRPTVDNGSALSIEVNLLDFDGDLYDQFLTVELMHRLRSEVRFASLDELRNQLQQDCNQVRQILG